MYDTTAMKCRMADILEIASVKAYHPNNIIRCLGWFNLAVCEIYVHVIILIYIPVIGGF